MLTASSSLHRALLRGSAACSPPRPVPEPLHWLSRMPSSACKKNQTASCTSRHSRGPRKRRRHVPRGFNGSRVYCEATTTDAPVIGPSWRVNWLGGAISCPRFRRRIYVKGDSRLPGFDSSCPTQVL